jgi:5'-nucleotidase
MEEPNKSSSNRRQWIKAGLGFLALGAVSPHELIANEAKRGKRLSVLHTNDWHSRIDPFPQNDPKFPGQGGASRRARLIEQIRAEGGEVLLLDAGDIVQGTPYFNYYAGKPEIELMNLMRYDAATLGNHDFDNGVEGLKKMLSWARFPFVNCNYGWGDTRLEQWVKPSVIVRRGGLRIGILGVGLELGPLLPAENIKGIHYYDPIQKANSEALKLKKGKGCDLVICLSHLGYSYPDSKVSDRVLASQSRNIDAILGGHTHTFLEKPEVSLNLEGNSVIINQVGWAGLRLGRVNWQFSSCNNTNNKASAQIEDFKKSIAI